MSAAGGAYVLGGVTPPCFHPFTEHFSQCDRVRLHFGKFDHVCDAQPQATGNSVGRQTSVKASF